MEFSITDNLGRTIEIKGTILDNPSEDVAYTYYNVVQMIDWRFTSPHTKRRQVSRWTGASSTFTCCGVPCASSSASAG